MVWERLGRPGAVELAVLCDGADALHGLVLEALETCIVKFVAPRLDGARITVRPVEVGPAAVTSAQAKLAGRAVPDAVADLLFDEERQVVVNGAAGPSTTKLILAGLAGVRGVPVVLAPDASNPQGVLLRFPPVALDRAETLRRLDAVDHLLALGAEGSLARQAGVDDLVIAEEGGGRRPSRIAARYARWAAETPPLRHYPAGAELLERLGQSQLAGQLRTLVGRWVRQRLWAANLVPELVVHDERHVERVDHLLATLIAPLAADHSLTSREVFLLSCAAWLHDWGHVGGLLGSPRRFVDHPIDVRSLHGLLTAARLWDYPGVHGLEDRQAAGVGVLAAHHQGWTSCGGEDPTPGDVHKEALARFTVAASSLQEDATTAGLDPDRAPLLVGLLRVADAADVGRHRVPQYASQTDYLKSCAQQTLGRTAAQLPNHLSGRAARQVGDALDTLLEDLSCQPARDTLEAHRREPFVQRLLGYLDFLDKQGPHYDLHQDVLWVRITHTEAGFSTLVTPAPGADPGRARDHVSAHVRRELDKPSGTTTVGKVLDEVGLSYQGARSVDREAGQVMAARRPWQSHAAARRVGPESQ